MVTVVTIPTPQLAATAAVVLVATALFWLFYFFRRRRSHPPLSYEYINGNDIGIYEEKTTLAGKDYRHIGQMPATFLCPHCKSSDCISIQMYHHIPSSTMILLSRHKCQRLEDRSTVPMPVAELAARMM